MPCAQVPEQGQWGTGLCRAGFSASHPRNRTNAAILRGLAGPAQRQYYPSSCGQLALISAWDTSSSASWAQQLQQVIQPMLAFQGKGLWATREGVVTFPLTPVQYPLALQSHFYEFPKTCQWRAVVQLGTADPGMRVTVPLLPPVMACCVTAPKISWKWKGFCASVPTLRFISRLVRHRSGG